MKEPIWILPETVTIIHQLLMTEHGGLLGIRDKSLLESALARPQQLFAYTNDCNLFSLAAAYSAGIVKNHPFVDGNKRVAFTIATTFLELNGYEVNAPNSEVVILFESLASGQITEGALAEWFSDNNLTLS
jgi:death-on-curing protein